MLLDRRSFLAFARARVAGSVLLAWALAGACGTVEPQSGVGTYDVLVMLDFPVQLGDVTSPGPPPEPDIPVVTDDGPATPDAADGNVDTALPDTAEDADGGGHDTGTPDIVEPDIPEPDVIDPPLVDCSKVAGTPVPFHTLYGFTTSEDFAFDQEGHIVSTDNGNLVKQTKDGTKKLLTPNMGFTAGTAYLPDGNLVVASVDNGSLWRIAPNGSKTTVLSGLQYPNGLDVDELGFVYVAEQDGQRLRRVNPWTGDFTVIGEDMCNANGVSFAPGYERVYVGSFGCGVVYALDRTGPDSWGPPWVFGEVDEDQVQQPEDPDLPKFCDGLEPGAPCQEKGSGAGSCQPGGTSLTCQASDAQSPLQIVCKGKEYGDVCQVEAAGNMYPGFCETNGYVGEGLECDIDDNPTCDGMSQGERCIKLTYGYLYWGSCKPSGGGLRCNGEPSNGGGGGGWGNGGGLDGLNVDACGNVYVTEYVKGLVWRFDPDGGGLAIAADLPSSWIPNMHWGSGVGGWDPTVLYVADRDQGRLFGLEIGVLGKEVTAP